MSVARLAARVLILVQCLLGREKRGEHRHIENDDTYERYLDTTTERLIGIARHVMKYLS